ncbi:hypothetical protein KCU79_g175, partial [Aureobasidium melanogenum]
MTLAQALYAWIAISCTFRLQSGLGLQFLARSVKTGSGWIAQSRSLFLLGLFGSESATRDDIAGFGLAQRLGDVERGVLNKGTFGISGRTRQISVGVVE